MLEHECEHVYSTSGMQVTLLTAHRFPSLSTCLTLFLIRGDWPESLVGNVGISPFFSLKSLEDSCLSWIPEQELIPGYLVNWDSVTVLVPKGKTPAGRVATYLPTDPRGRVNHVNARSAGENLPIADDMRHVDVALDAALLELHVVLREGASLVCEDVLHLQTQGLAGWCWPGMHTLLGEGEGAVAASDPRAAVLPNTNGFHMKQTSGFTPSIWLHQPEL